MTKELKLIPPTDPRVLSMIAPFVDDRLEAEGFKNRQELNNFYYLDGFMFIFTIRKFVNSKNFLDKSAPFFTNEKKSIDIDDFASFKIAKKNFKK